MDADTRELLAGSIRSLLQSRPGDLVDGLAELGWADVVSDDEAAAVALLFTEQGRAGVASAALDGVMIAAGGGGPDPGGPHLLVVHPFASVASVVTDGRLRVDGVVLAEPSDAGAYVVGIDNDVYTVMTADVEPSTPVGGFDPASSLRRVRFDVDGVGEVQKRAGEWEIATAAARRALASELVGNGQAMLDLAAEHVGQRQQFGRPIGANQTPRHRLADAYVQLSAAYELVQVAWASGTPWDALVAKAYAGQATDATARVCLQVCGAMGLTSEHPLGEFVKRARTLDALHGRWQHAMRAIGEDLLASRAIPRGARV